MPRKALIIVDMLNDFLDPKGVLFCGEAARDIIPFIQQRLQAFREKHDAVIYLRDAHDEDDKEFEKFPPHCVAGTWGGNFLTEIKPLPGENIIPKKRFSGFYGTDLEKFLTRPESITPKSWGCVHRSASWIRWAVWPIAIIKLWCRSKGWLISIVKCMRLPCNGCGVFTGLK